MSAATQLRHQESAAPRHSLPIPGSQHSVSVAVELVPGEQLTPALQSSSNVARVSVGGMEFFAVVGKTGLDPNG